jgi:pyrroline-5-carboxylate reductase
MKKIGILGLGKMGSAILAGILSKQIFKDDEIITYDPYRQEPNIESANNEKDLYEASEIVLFAIKPQLFPEVLIKLKQCTNHPLIISIAGGITLATLEDAFPKNRLIRIMPNLAATINESVSVYSKNSVVTTEDEAMMVKIFSSLGSITPIQEEQMDGVVGLNGSFPAYLYYFLEAMIQAGINDGFDPDVAKQLIIDTALSSLHLAKQDARSLSQLIKDICSPHGITLEGIKVMEEAQIQKIMNNVYQASKKRSMELGQKK